MYVGRNLSKDVALKFGRKIMEGTTLEVILLENLESSRKPTSTSWLSSLSPVNAAISDSWLASTSSSHWATFTRAI
uniref:PDZ domain-containing protein n=1 Tax=Heterorhabditis bacteriophora TaxID=37862 RepID=A0A1I7WI81_HETBA